jgi:hypothetical protein
MKFTDEHKVVKEFSDQNWFDYGVHKVQIAQIDLDKTEAGKEFMEFTLVGEAEQEDTARVWFSTDKAINYSINILRQIFVHNAPEAKKDEARDMFDAIGDTEELHKLLNEKLVGGNCWFSKFPSPNRTYQATDGSTKKSIDKNIYGYEPKGQPGLTTNADDPVDLNSDSSVASGIPSNW